MSLKKYAIPNLMIRSDLFSTATFLINLLNSFHPSDYRFVKAQKNSKTTCSACNRTILSWQSNTETTLCEYCYEKLLERKKLLQFKHLYICILGFDWEIYPKFLSRYTKIFHLEPFCDQNLKIYIYPKNHSPNLDKFRKFIKNDFNLGDSGTYHYHGEDLTSLEILFNKFARGWNEIILKNGRKFMVNGRQLPYHQMTLEQIDYLSIIGSENIYGSLLPGKPTKLEEFRLINYEGNSKDIVGRDEKYYYYFHWHGS